MTSQGPYSNKPTFDPPKVENWEWGSNEFSKRFAGWGQVRDGSWYAFYCNVGPGVTSFCPNPSWNIEHETDPNWWYNENDSPQPATLVCRHGAVPGTCPDGSCGDAPAPAPTDEEVEEAALKAVKLLKSLECNAPQ